MSGISLLCSPGKLTINVAHVCHYELQSSLDKQSFKFSTPSVGSQVSILRCACANSYLVQISSGFHLSKQLTAVLAS